MSFIVPWNIVILVKKIELSVQMIGPTNLTT